MIYNLIIAWDYKLIFDHSDSTEFVMIYEVFVSVIITRVSCFFPSIVKTTKNTTRNVWKDRLMSIPSGKTKNKHTEKNRMYNVHLDWVECVFETPRKKNALVVVGWSISISNGLNLEDQSWEFPLCLAASEPFGGRILRVIFQFFKKNLQLLKPVSTEVS